ncbi:MAG: hypothetical protein HY699_14485 [Deltaproteobacteria bacterium]|nr:hypothetical protein [Deltaproteobacteria bacterium]
MTDLPGSEHRCEHNPPQRVITLVSRRPPRHTGARVALLVAVLVAGAAGVWWWQASSAPNAAKSPSASPPAAPEPPLPLAAPDRFTVALAHLGNDTDGLEEQRLVAALADAEPAQLLRFDRTIAPTGMGLGASTRAGHDTARGYLAEAGAQAVMWGVVTGHQEEQLVSLCWTLASQLRHGGRWGRYELPGELLLPAVGWRELADVVRLLVVAHSLEFYGAEAGPSPERLRTLVETVRPLAYAPRGRRVMSNESRANLRFALATALALYGEHTGRAEALQEAVTILRELLAEGLAGNESLRPAAVQNNLGNALSRLGVVVPDVASQRAYLERATSAYQAAVMELSGKGDRPSWATAQSNLGTALTALGERAYSTSQLEQAGAAFRAALTERARDRDPLAWVATQIGLGVSLRRLGERSKQAGTVCQALEAHLSAWAALGTHAAVYGGRTAAEIERDRRVLESAFSPAEVRDCFKRNEAQLSRLPRPPAPPP